LDTSVAALTRLPHPLLGRPYSLSAGIYLVMRANESQRAVNGWRR
jgi:hypothetical protein